MFLLKSSEAHEPASRQMSPAMKATGLHLLHEFFVGFQSSTWRGGYVARLLAAQCRAFEGLPGKTDQILSIPLRIITGNFNYVTPVTIYKGCWEWNRSPACHSARSCRMQTHL
jgi:hypothetical protein